MSLPRFINGSGLLTAEVLNQVMEATEQAEIASGFNPGETIPGWTGPIPCEIVSSEEITDIEGDGINRWLYEVRQLVFSDHSTATHESYTFDSVGNWCINLAEWGNTAAVAGGITLATLPGDFSMDPIPAGTAVLLWRSAVTNSTGGSPYWLGIFERTNQFSGDC